MQLNDINDTSPSGAVLAQVIRFTDDPVHGTLALGSVYTDTPGAITRSYQVGGVQFAEPYVVTMPAVSSRSLTTSARPDGGSSTRASRMPSAASSTTRTLDAQRRLTRRLTALRFTLAPAR